MRSLELPAVYLSLELSLIPTPGLASRHRVRPSQVRPCPDLPVACYLLVQ
jgi:hypothetical protein